MVPNSGIVGLMNGNCEMARLMFFSVTARLLRFRPRFRPQNSFVKPQHLMTRLEPLKKKNKTERPVKCD